MDIVWDEWKNEANIRNHGLDFSDAYHIFDGPLLVAQDDREAYGEERWIGIGFIETRVVVIVFSEPDEDEMRVISLRKAQHLERQRFEQYLAHRLDAG